MNLLKKGHLEIGENLKEGWGAYESGVSGPFAMAEPFTALVSRMVHIKEGESYNSDCKICKE